MVRPDRVCAWSRAGSTTTGSASRWSWRATGFRFVELVYVPRLGSFDRVSAPLHRIDVLPATQDDLGQVEDIAYTAFTTGRFLLDGRLDPDLSRRRYGTWVRTSLRSREQSVLKAELAGSLVGFFIVEDTPDRNVYWHLTAVAPQWQGKGIGLSLWQTMLMRHKSEGAVSVATTISGHNLPALNLYARLGFNIASSRPDDLPLVEGARPLIHLSWVRVSPGCRRAQIGRSDLRVCSACGAPLADQGWVCAECGYGPATIGGFAAFAPTAAHGTEGFQESFFGELSRLEEQSFWFTGRNELIVWAMTKYFPGCKSFLEIGCGTGWVLTGIRSAFPSAELTGSEILVAGLEIASERVPSARFYQMDARSIPFREYFDVIGAFDVLEHIDDDELVLSQISQAVRPGGVLLLSVPQHPRLWSRQDERAHHVRRYTAAELRHKVVAGGLRSRPIDVLRGPTVAAAFRLSSVDGPPTA